MTRVALAVCLVLVPLGSGLSLTSQAPAPPPTVVPVKAPELTEVQQLRLQATMQRMEIAQYKSQLAQQDYLAAREALVALLRTVEVPGYTLDLATWRYTPVKPPADAKGAP